MNPAQATNPILLTMPGFDRFTYDTAMLRERFPSLMAPSHCFLEVLTTWVKERRFARSVGHDILAMLEDVKDKIGASVALYVIREFQAPLLPFSLDVDCYIRDSRSLNMRILGC